MKNNEKMTEDPVSVVQRLIRNRKLLEAEFVLRKDKYKTAENRRLNNFAELLENKQGKKDK